MENTTARISKGHWYQELTASKAICNLEFSIIAEVGSVVIHTHFKVGVVLRMTQRFR
jgi:hypothetical protein